MSEPTGLEFGGTDEELEKYLLEFAAAVGGWVRREPNRAAWRLSAGSLLSANSNTLPLRLRVTREERRLSIRSSAGSLPWTRAKTERIAAYRQGQLADFLTMRARGAGRGTFDALRLREPFATYGSGVAAVTASFAWGAAGAVAAMLAALIAATLASLPLMHLAIGEILERARVVQAAGGVAIPNPDQPLSLLGSAFVFAVPLAFLAGFVHSVALAASELWFRADRLPAASCFALGVLFAVALFPFTPILAIPCAILVPLAAHAGHALVWGRRRERVREGGRPRKGILIIGAALAAVVAASLVPAVPEGHREWTDRLALFRDRFMLGNPLGKFAATVYYRHTLVGAEPLKSFFSSDPEVAVRTLRTAYSDSPLATDTLRASGFVVTHDPKAKVDVRIVLNDQELKAVDFDKLAREEFRGTMLRHIYGMAWHSLYYGGPIFVLFVLAGVICPAVSILFRRFNRRAALMVLGVVFLLSSGIVMSALSSTPEAWERLQALRNEPGPGPIAAGLGSPALAVRHEAAFQAFRHPDPSLGTPLLKAADDEDVRVRLWAVAALGETKHLDALAKLVARLDDPELFVRYRAAEGLGFLGRPEAIEPLLKMTREGTWYEGLYALEALRKIDPKRF